MISASLYSSDHLDFRKAVTDAEMLGAQSLHVDIMDGSYVAGFGLNLKLIEAVGRISKLPVDVHFMTRSPSRFFGQYISPRVRTVFFHPDTEPDPEKSLRQIREKGAEPGLALSLDADLASLADVYRHCKSILLMSIQPGTEQSCNEAVLERIEYLNGLRASGRLRFDIAVDGGLVLDTARKCRACGADQIVLGRALFRAAETDGPVRGVNEKNPFA